MDYQNQIDLENLYHKNQLKPRLNAEYDVEPIHEQADKLRLSQHFVRDLLVNMMILKRANISTLVGILHHHFDTMQECVDAICVATEGDLLDYQSASDMFIVRIMVSDAIISEIERFQYPLPMVVEPEPVMNNNQTGYLTPNCSRGSIILKKNHHNEDVCLDHINRVNKTKLTLNAQVVHFVNNVWKGIDKIKEGETSEEYMKRRKAFEKYNEHSKDVIDALILMGNEIYLTHKYDKRGRVYCQGYHVNPQGNDWNKACVEFANKEIIN